MSNPTPPADSKGIPARVHLAPDHYFLGYVKDALFYVEDDIGQGASFRALTHSGPGYKPIPLTQIEHNDHTIEYLSPVDSASAWPGTRRISKERRPRCHAGTALAKVGL